MLITDLTEQQILALAISNEEEDSRIYRAFSSFLAQDYPSSAKVFNEMANEEVEHRSMLYALYKSKFGDFLPLIRRQDVKGILARKPLKLRQGLSLATLREEAEMMEKEAASYYRRASEMCRDVSIRQFLIELAETEEGHAKIANDLENEHLTETVREIEDKKAHKQFVLTYVQPGLAGLIDGSVSTLAPLFAAAFVTMNTWETFIVGLAASIGAGISMGLTEAFSDDGVISGRGSPFIRGVVTGLMTLIGGLGHTIPYLIKDFTLATTIALIVVVIELMVIAWIRYKYMQTSFFKSVVQIIIGGALVVATGILLGKA